MMKDACMFLYLSIVVLFSCVSCYTTVNSSRRGCFQSVASGCVTILSGLSMNEPKAWAMDTFIITTASSKFEGTYSDPINHPGGKRTIRILPGQKTGDYQLAEIVGGGGRGEPQSYVLPAVIFGDRAIVIDFSPKGGPRDFVGVLASNGDITFQRDGNTWPRIK